MPPEDENIREASDSPSEPSESNVAELARNAQEKPKDLKDKDEQHHELRKQGLTPSSADLPKLDLGFDNEGKLVAKVADKSLKLPLPTEGGQSEIPDIGMRKLPLGDIELPKLSPDGGLPDGGIRALPLGDIELPKLSPDGGLPDGGIRALPLGELSPEDVNRINEAAREVGHRADLPLGELSPEDVNRINEAAREVGHRAELPSGERPEPTGDRAGGEKRPEAPADKSDEGKVGDRSKDAGRGTLEKPEVTRTTIDGKERVTDYKMPDGSAIHVKYDDKGEPTSVTMPDTNGKPGTFEKQGDKWVNKDNPKQTLQDVRVDDKGNVTILTGGEIVNRGPDPKSSADDAGDNMKVVIGPDGSYKKTSENEQRKYAEIEPDGTTHVYRHDDIMSPSGKVTEVVTKPGSHVSELKTYNEGNHKDPKAGESAGYEVKDDHGHVTKVERNADGGTTVTRGDRTEKYDGEPEFKDGKLTVKNKDGSSLEVRSDGTEIRKNKDQQITEITNSDGEKTKFTLSGKNVTGVTSFDSQGKELRKETGKVEVKPDGTYTIELPQKDLDARKADGVKETPVKLERSPDGTERLLDKDGNKVESDADRLMSHFKKYSPEEQKQLRQDLADIDRMPKEQREAIYKSLEKIAYNDDLQKQDPKPKIELTGQQSRELVASLAHQIAHPESIQQGAHESCAAANMEHLMAKNNPAQYADMVSKLATEGEYKLPPPSTKTVTAENHDGKLDPKGDAYGTRSYSSELFQDAAIQLAVHPKTYKSLPLDSPEIQPRPDKVTPASDYGERLIDPSNPGKPERFTGLDTQKQLQAYKELFPNEKYGDVPVKSAKDLEDAFKKNGPPMKVGISLEGDKAKTGMSDEAGTEAGNHAVVITKIENGKVYYENTAGGTDHSYPKGQGVPIDDFVEAMKKGEKGAFVKGQEGKGAGTGKGSEGSFGVPEAQAQEAAPKVAEKHASPAGSEIEERFKPAKANNKPSEVEADGTKRVVTKDGDIRIDNPDGTRSVRDMEKDGSYSENHFGPRPEDNYVVKKTADGKYMVAECSPDGELVTSKFREVSDHNDPRVERARLRDVAEQKISDPKELAKFEADMAKFDGREKELRDRYEKQGMKPEEAAQKAQKELAETYQEVQRLLEAKDNPNVPFTEKDRIRLAREVMHQAGDPTDVSQGSYNTCNSATIESRAYAKSPSEAARLVSDIATKGEYTTNGDPPVTVKVGRDIDKDSLLKHGDSKEAHEAGANHRSYASQIFQVTAVNIHYARENAKTTPPGQIRYEQHKQGRDTVVDGKTVSDNGERLVDYSKKGPNGKPPAEVMDSDGKTGKRAPGMSPGDIAKVAQDIAPDPKDGEASGPTRLDFSPVDVVANRTKEIADLNDTVSKVLKDNGVIDKAPLDLKDPEAVKKAREALDKKEDMDPKTKEMLRTGLDRLEKTNPYVNFEGQALVGTEQQMNDALAKLKAEGRLPVIVGVHTGKEPFSTDCAEAGARGGAHVVTITDYQPGPPPKVTIDNQWDKKADHKDLPVSTLFEAMKHRDAGSRIEELQKEVDSNRAGNKIDYTKETELLYQKHAAGKINDQELADGIVKTFKETREAKRDGKLSDEQRQQIQDKLMELREQLPGGKNGEAAKKLNERLKAIIEEEKAQGKK